MSPKVKSKKVTDKNPAISEAKLLAEKSASELINFSFKYLVTQNDKFPFECDEAAYYIEVISRIKDLSTFKKMEFLVNRSSTLRMHPIKWEETSEKDGFKIPSEEQIVDTPYQFALTANEHGRMHGFFISNTFYLVWFDRKHALYPK